VGDGDWVGFDGWVGRRLAHDGTPGLTLAVTDRERTLRVATYGFADLAARAPVTPATRFEFGSIGKSFTALLLLRLRERGLVDFDAPVTDYLPWFAVRSSHAPITIHHLLCHTAGIVGGTDVSLNGRFETWALRETEVSGPPGAHFRYSNVGYKTLGWIVEDLLGTSYGEAVTAEILAPLGMGESVVPIRNEHRARMAVGYRGLRDDRPYRPEHGLTPATWFECGTADGSLAATPDDMATYARLMLNRGGHPGGRIVSEESFALLTANHSTPPWGENSTYGYGWGRSTWDGRELEGHGGGMVGYYSALMIDRETGIGAFTSINGPGDPAAFAVQALAVARALIGGEAVPEPPAIPDRRRIDDASIAGAYEGEIGRIELLVEDGAGTLVSGGERAPLLARRDNEFLVDHPGWERFPLRLERNEGAIVGLVHGGRWFIRDGAEPPPTPVAPAEWSPYPGLYRAWNPWGGLFRVVERRGALRLVHPGGSEEPLAPLADGSFRVGEEPSSERLRFDALAAGQALRSTFNGEAFYRQPE
jgi:D-alanyl-D-alanine carboxypeptidase